MTKYRARHPLSPVFDFATLAGIWALTHGLRGDEWEIVDAARILAGLNMGDGK